MWEAHASFELFRAIQYSKGIDLHGKETAERNVRVINKHKEFFVPVMKSLYLNSTLGLWMFFDKEDNLGYLALLKEMKPVTNYEVFEKLKTDISKKLLPYKIVISKIRKIRHEQIAHVSKESDEVELSMQEVEDLYKVTQDIFNLLCGHFEDSKTIFPLNDKEARGEIDALMRDLDLGFEEYKKIVHRRYFPEKSETL